jgi:hypothetical protein
MVQGRRAVITQWGVQTKKQQQQAKKKGKQSSQSSKGKPAATDNHLGRSTF